MATTLDISSLAHALTNATPLSLHALSSHPSDDPSTDPQTELAHYKDLFSKLRFSYTEQVTKERFLKSLVADPPELVIAEDELSLLESKLSLDKQALQAKKAAVAQLLASLDARSRELAREHELQNDHTAMLVALPDEVSALTAEVEALRAARPVMSDNPLLNHGLSATREMLDERREEAVVLEGEEVGLLKALKAKKDEVQRLKGEKDELEERKRRAVAEVLDLRRRRGEGDAGWDEEERRARWARAQKGVLEGLVG